MNATLGTDVLVVEDDDDLRAVLVEALRFEGFRVAEAGDGADALAHLRGGERPALILLDLVMPRMDGREFLGAVGEDAGLSSIPVVLVTGTPPSDLKGKVAAILKKPIGMDDLLVHIRRHVHA